MKKELPTHRLRLFILGLSLFCFGVAAAQSTASQPPGVSVLEWKWQKFTSNGMHYTGTYPPSVNQHTDNVPNPIPLEWPSGTAFGYSVRIRNEGPKVIKSLAFDYVFDDAASKTELARRSLRSFEKIALNKTKSIEIRAVPLGPPKVATVEGMQKDRRSPFDEHVEIKCVLYSDGTGWKAPDAESKICDELVRLTLHPDARRK